MGKSQTRRLREATKRFGRENWSRLASTRATLSELAYAKKVEAGLVSPAVAAACPTYNDPKTVKRYSTSLSHKQNELVYGRSWK